MKHILLRIIIPLCFVYACCFADGFRVDLLHTDLAGGPLVVDTLSVTPLADGCAIQVLEDFGTEGVVPLDAGLRPIPGSNQPAARRSDDAITLAVNGAARFDSPGFFFIESAASGANLPRHPLRFRIWNANDPAQASAWWDSPPYTVLPGNQQVSFNRSEWTFHRINVPDKCDGEQRIASVESSAVARQYEMLIAYPNPFNSSAQVMFSLERAGPVELTVYDLQGRLQRTLLNGPQSAGQHRIMFDGRALPTGVYFVSLRTGNRAPQIHRLVLMR